MKKTQERLEACLKDGDATALRTLLEEDASLARRAVFGGISPLLAALYRRDEASAAVVCEFATQLDVFEAAATGDTARLEALLAEDPDCANARAADGFGPLHLAAFFARPAAVAALLRAGADVNAPADHPDAMRPLHSMVPGCDAEVARLLCDAGADVNARQRGGYTALHAAARRGDLAVVHVLLDAGADPALAADDGSTARTFAAGQDDVLRLLEG